MPPKDITHIGLTATEADKVAHLAGDIRDRFPAGRVVQCHAVGEVWRALCFTRADGRMVACVAAELFLAASHNEAVTLLTPLYD